MNKPKKDLSILSTKDKFSIGAVLDLFVSISSDEKQNRDEIALDTNGVIDDKFYAKTLKRSVLITSRDSYILAQENAIHIPSGALGENILIDTNPYSLNSGDKIKIGEVELEITQHCTICKSLSKIDPELPSLLRSDRGVFAKVINGGKIRKGDLVKFEMH